MTEQSHTETKTPAKKPRLGRGLASLINSSAHIHHEEHPAAGEGQYVSNQMTETTSREPRPQGSGVVESSAQKQAEKPHEIAITEISPNPYQPRREFDEAQLAELAESIRQQGILQPLIVTPMDGASNDGRRPYALIAGERRLRAADRAGLTAVPCIIRQATARQMMEWALIENIQRSDLNPLERAHAYREYIDRFNLTQQDAAQRMGQPRTTVANYLRILDLEQEPQKMIADGSISFGHAKVLAGLIGSPSRQLALARKIAGRGLSVRQLEVLVTAALAEAAQENPALAKPRRAKPPYVADLEEKLSSLLGTRITISPARSKNSGRITIEYYNLDDFDRIAGLLGYKADA